MKKYTSVIKIKVYCRSFIRENLKIHNMSLNNEKGFEEEHKVDLEADKGITQYTDLMKQMLETLIAQACEMAGFVYQKYCIDKKSLDEITEEFQVDKKSLLLITKYFDNLSM